MRRLLFCSVLALCGACIAPASATPAPGGPRASAEEGPEDLVEAALLASGYESELGRRAAREELLRHLNGAVAQARSAPDELGRARALLAALHAKGSLLGTYDARATTLEDMLSGRRYNCVSASVVYNLAAERLGLSVAAQLLPTHARSLLSVAEQGRLRGVVIETTSPSGFDPGPEAQQRILQQVAGPAADGARALVSERGEVVSTRVLIGTIYVNRASIAQEGGQLELAERLFARGEAVADNNETMRRVLRDQRAALMAQLAADDVLSEDPKRYGRAYQTLKAAVTLAPQDPIVRQTLFQNLRAAAERVMSQQAERGDEQALVALAGEAASFGLRPEDRSGLRAFALSEVARLRIEKGAYDAAVEAIDLALREQLGAEDQDLARILRANRVAALRLAALERAKGGAYPAARAYLERIQALPDLSAEDRAQLEQDGLRIIHLVGNRHIDDLDYPAAAEVYREGVRRYPKDETSRHNLLAVLERLASAMVKQGRCGDAAPYLEEVSVLEPKADFPKKAQSRCLVERARQRLDADDASEAVALLSQARRLDPEDVPVRRALAVALSRWVQALVQGGRCEEAKAQAKGLLALGDARIKPKEVQALLRSCGR